MTIDASQNVPPERISERTDWHSVDSRELRDYVASHFGEALERGWILPFYQPVVRTITGRLCSFEALARWDDPQYGLLPPDVFIGVLEEERVIHRLDISIIDQVCWQYRQCVDGGLPVVPVSVNLSRLDFDLCDIFAEVEAALRRYEMPRNMINIEITESVLGQDPEFMRDKLLQFHQAGYQVWMDDFGSGYSTLNVLREFDFDELKIDMEFLHHFGGKARTIIASVVNMAKQLGLQTLAEGVETEEHQEFLREIGCEKQQGYLYGRPHPFEIDYNRDLMCRLGVDPLNERHYLAEQGRVNIIGLSEGDFLEGSASERYLTRLPLALVEYDGSDFRIVDSNEPFLEGLRSVGIPSVDVALGMVNNPRNPMYQVLRRHAAVIATDRFARCDYTFGGVECIMRIKYIASLNGRTTTLITIDSTASRDERKRRDRMHEVLEVLYSVYEHVDILHLDEGYSEPVFSNASFHQVYGMPDLAEAIREFADHEVYPLDRPRYLRFLDIATLWDRLEANGQGFLVGFFRMRSEKGNFTWRMFGLIPMRNMPGNQVLVCIRSTNWDNDSLFQMVYGHHAGEAADAARMPEADLAVTDGALWRALQMDSRFGFFWKDRERRFLGANETMLEFFNCRLEDIVGRADDETLGWLIDPIIVRADDERVLNEGARVRGAAVQCIVNGEVRDVVVVKRPIYRNGTIVGLLGYFADAAAWSKTTSSVGSITTIDPVTGVNNYTGLEAAIAHYVDAYVKRGIDFSMICLDIDHFKRINDVYGYEVGDKVLRRVADEIRAAVGASSVIGHTYADRFVIVRQDADMEQARATCRDIELRLRTVSDIGNGVSVTVYAVLGAALYSEVEDVDEMKHLARSRVDDCKRARRSS